MIPAGVTNSAAKRIVFTMNMLADGGDDEEGKAQAALYAINAIKTQHIPEDQEKIIKQVLRLIKNPEDPFSKNVAKILEESTSELEMGWSDMLKLSKAKTSPRMARELEQRGLQD